MELYKHLYWRLLLQFACTLNSGRERLNLNDTLHEYLRLLLFGLSLRNPSDIRTESAWDLCWSQWHWETVISQYFGPSLRVSFLYCSKFIFFIHSFTCRSYAKFVTQSVIKQRRIHAYEGLPASRRASCTQMV